jgi:hypothetical protein
MAATVYGAIKAYMEPKLAAQNLSITGVFRDLPPEKTKRPYLTFLGGISLILDPREDGGPAGGSEATATEKGQLDLWQDWADSSGNTLETDPLADAVARLIDGANLSFGTPTKRIYGVLLRNRTRLTERDNKIVHHAFTVDLRRAI